MIGALARKFAKEIARNGHYRAVWSAEAPQDPIMVVLYLFFTAHQSLQIE